MFNPKTLRVFLSHSSLDVEFVEPIKNALVNIGFEVFVAHEDIEPASDFPEEIISNLNSSDIFVAVLSKNFKESAFADQETGIAVARDIFIVPIQIDKGVPPYGFIWEKQSLRCFKKELLYSKVESKIIDLLKKRKEFSLKSFLITSLANSKSWRTANSRAKLLKDLFKDFSKDEIRYLYESARTNSELQGWDSGPILIALFKKHNECLTEKELKEAISALS